MIGEATRSQLESYLWGAATLLRGTIGAGDYNYKQFIFPPLPYKRQRDVFDEEAQTALAESGGDKRYMHWGRSNTVSEFRWRPLARGATGG